MSFTAWVSELNGLPSFRLPEAGILVASEAGAERLVYAADYPCLVADAAAPVGIPVLYRFNGAHAVTLTRRGVGHHFLTDSIGRSVAAVKWVGNDEREHDAGATTAARVNGGDPIVRWTALPPSPSGSLQALTTGESTLRLRTLIGQREPLWLIHDPTICQIRGCDIDPARLIVPTSAKESRSPRKDQATRAWQISYRQLLNSPVRSSPAITWGEWEASGGVWENVSAAEVAEAIAGMPGGAS